jgi:tryptophan synthase alpha chain
LPAVLKYSAGFVYFVSVLGITGTKSATEDAVRTHVARIKRHTDLPIGVGFGIKTPEQAAAVARHADAAVVGTAIVDRVKMGLDAAGKAKADLVPNLLSFVKSLADGVRGVTKA